MTLNVKKCYPMHFTYNKTMQNNKYTIAEEIVALKYVNNFCIKFIISHFHSAYSKLVFLINNINAKFYC